jgi:hypothetical protein
MMMEVTMVEIHGKNDGPETEVTSSPSFDEAMEMAVRFTEALYELRKTCKEANDVFQQTVAGLRKMQEDIDHE